jgi:hypothetical protein
MDGNVYWRDCNLQTASDDALVDLAGQLEALTRNTRIREIPELLARVGARMADVLEEIDARLGQLRLY